MQANVNNILNALSEAQAAVLIKAGRRSSKICGRQWKELIKYSYIFVKVTIPEAFESGNVMQIIEKGEGKAGSVTDKELVAFLLWVYDEMKAIAEMEETYLQGIPKAEHLQAGIDRFKEFGELNTIYGLCEKYGWSMDYVWNLTYEEVFNLRLYGKVEAEFNEKLQKIMIEKSKRKGK